MTPPIPQRLGAYVIHDRIGDGGMAEIFLAKMLGYSGFEKQVALKRILPRYSQNPAFARMLIEEAKLAARIQHLNVVQVHDLGEIGGQVFIAMEYVRGRDLAALLSNAYRRRERIPIEITLFIALEFLTGLDYAHRLTHPDGSPLALIHRDISPQNVLISYEGEVKLTDFGIARVIESTGETRLPGNLHGKFGYMSPEQVEGLPLDQRSDVFGAGVVLHEMLTGQRLFRAKTPKATIELIRTTTIAAPSTVSPEVPAVIDEITLRALSKNRDERYQTVGAFLGELSRAADQLPRRASRRDLAVYMKRQFGAAVRDDTRPSGPPRTQLLGPEGSPRIPLGQLAARQLGVQPTAIDLALTEQRARGGRIGELLVEAGVIDEVGLASVLAVQAGLRAPGAEELADTKPPTELLTRYPRTVAEGTLVVPLALDAKSATLATADPYAHRALLEAKIVLGVGETTTVVVAKSEIRRMISSWWPAELVAEAADIIVEQPVDYVEPAPELRPIVILADPDPKTAQPLAERLRREDLDVQVFADGKRARAYAREHNPMVLVLDTHLPGVDGFNVLLDVRARSADAAVFLTSARPEPFTESKALELGADDFFPRPYNLEVVTSKVRRELQKRATRRPQVAVAAPAFNGVTGSLAEMSLVDIVQGLELARKTAVVVVEYEDERRGEIIVREGRIVQATAGAESGEEAFYALATPGDGVFRIEYRRVPPSAGELVLSPTALILEALRRIDEAERDGRRATFKPLSTADLPSLPAPPPGSAPGSAPTTAPAPALDAFDPLREYLEPSVPPGLAAALSAAHASKGEPAATGGAVAPGTGPGTALPRSPSRVARIELRPGRAEGTGPDAAPRSRRDELARLADELAPQGPVPTPPAGTHAQPWSALVDDTSRRAALTEGLSLGGTPPVAPLTSGGLDLSTPSLGHPTGSLGHPTGYGSETPAHPVSVPPPPGAGGGRPSAAPQSWSPAAGGYAQPAGGYAQPAGGYAQPAGGYTQPAGAPPGSPAGPYGSLGHITPAHGNPGMPHGAAPAAPAAAPPGPAVPSYGAPPGYAPPPGYGQPGYGAAPGYPPSGGYPPGAVPFGAYAAGPYAPGAPGAYPPGFVPPPAPSPQGPSQAYPQPAPGFAPSFPRAGAQPLGQPTLPPHHAGPQALGAPYGAPGQAGPGAGAGMGAPQGVGATPQGVGATPQGMGAPQGVGAPQAGGAGPGDGANRLVPPSRELSRSTTPTPEEADPRRRR